MASHGSYPKKDIQDRKTIQKYELEESFWYSAWNYRFPFYSTLSEWEEGIKVEARNYRRKWEYSDSVEAEWKTGRQGMTPEDFYRDQKFDAAELKRIEMDRFARTVDTIDGILTIGSLGVGAARSARNGLNNAVKSGNGVVAPRFSGNTVNDLTAAAQRASGQVGAGRGAVHGTRVHSAFEAEVNALGNANLATEQSYLNGAWVRRGTPGSIRVDVVVGPVTSPPAIYDLKTGSARLTPSRI